jgi:hypothetical protein
MRPARSLLPWIAVGIAAVVAVLLYRHYELGSC